MANKDMLRIRFLFKHKKENIIKIITFKKIQIFYRINNEYNFYDDDGILYCKCIINNNKLDDKYEEFTKGKLKLECFFKNDKFHGEFKTYDSSGNLEIICNFIDGNLEGIFKKFVNNKLVRICNYTKDRLKGSYKEFYEGTDDNNGKLKINCNYLTTKI